MSDAADPILVAAGLAVDGVDLAVQCRGFLLVDLDCDCRSSAELHVAVVGTAVRWGQRTVGADVEGYCYAHCCQIPAAVVVPVHSYSVDVVVGVGIDRAPGSEDEDAADSSLLDSGQPDPDASAVGEVVEMDPVGDPVVGLRRRRVYCHLEAGRCCSMAVSTHSGSL